MNGAQTFVALLRSRLLLCAVCFVSWTGISHMLFPRFYSHQPIPIFYAPCDSNFALIDIVIANLHVANRL